MKKLSFFNRIVFYLNVIVAVALLVACIVPYTDSASLAFLSLSVPLLVLVNALFVVFWVVKRNIRALFSISVLVYGYMNMGPFFQFGNDINPIDEKKALSLMSYNSLGFRWKDDVWGSTAGVSIVKFINKENPDFISFHEFDDRKMGKDYFNKYPYSFIDHELGEPQSGVLQAIFSKYPIINSGVLDFPDSSNSAIFSDIVYGKDTLRIYNLHLQSLSIRPRSIKRERSYRLFARLRRSFRRQLNQSEIVRAHVNSGPFKSIVSGDFNNNQFSRVYFNLRGDFKDSFLEKGTGFGTTINFWRFSFRIDYVLVDPSFEVVSHQNYDINLSDHEPIMASIKIASDE